LHQGLRLGRPWLALVLIAFCLPLLVGLGQPDLETDEAIYSFAVDRILADGNWLEPKSSPSNTVVFLEKPPLKFWMVAAPIRAGLLPHDEFGLRLVDVVLASAAFVYVFAIGTLLAGPVCGAVAVLLLFVHWPLVFSHGLRTNNMEAALVLSYCAGVFHFLRWSVRDDERGRRWHAVAASVFFVLGFMTKFVAALFLPFTLAIAALAAPRVRARLLADWRIWLQCVGLVLLLCAPWFVYAQVRFGNELWRTILGEHVLRRMTAYLDPTHLHPWYWYLQQLWNELLREQSQWLVVAGVATLAVQAVRRRWFEGMVILLWAVVPMVIISAGSSKLYHYAYPFLPPLALGAGYLAALVTMLAPVPLRRLFEWVEDRVAATFPGLASRAGSHGVRLAASALMVVAAALTIATLALGNLRITIDGRTLFRSSSMERPLMLVMVLALLTRTSARTVRLVVALLVFSAMPLAAYRRQIDLLDDGRHPIRTAAECLARVKASSGLANGLYIDMPEGVWHPLYYYLRRIEPVTEASSPNAAVIDEYLLDARSARPVLMSDSVWRQYQERRAAAGLPPVSPPMVPLLNSLLLTPGPYASCSSEAVLSGAR